MEMPPLKVLKQGQHYKGTMPTPETSSLSRRALNLPFVRMLTGIYFPFSRMKIYTKFFPGTLSLPSDIVLLGFCSAENCIRFLCFPPHVRPPQVSVGHTSGSLPPSTWFSSPTTPGCVRDEPRDAWHG